MATPTLASLLVRQTKNVIYTAGIRIARAIGLPVDTWQAGDPTRAQFWAEAELLESWEDIAIGFISAGFLETAATIGGLWVDICAKQFFNVDVPAATYAKTDVVLTNNEGGFFDNLEPGDLTFKNPSTGKTYRNITGGTLVSGPGPNAKLTVTVEAEEPGSGSTAGPGEISELVTGLLGVTCTNPTAAVGTDKQSVATTVQQCLDKLDSLSPNGPRGAYRFVARDPKKAGTNAVSRVRVYSESDTGEVTVYLAGPTGGVAEVDRALVEAGIVAWATPICFTPHVLSANNVQVAVNYQVWVYKSVNKTAAEIESDIAVAIAKMFSEREIGGDVVPPADGILARSLIETAIRSTYPQIFKVVVVTPAADVVLDRGDVAVVGLITPTINMVVDP